MGAGLPATGGRLSSEIEQALSDGDLPRALSLSLGDRYRIVDVLGQGGMGVVFKAEESDSGRIVAVKAMLGDVHKDRRLRYWREVRAMERVRHPNVVALYDHGGEHAPLPYLVLEFIDGTTLWAVLSVIPLPESVALCVLIELADALAAVHSAGIVHRDLKPENIFVEGAGRVVLGDFGIVRGAAGSSETFVRTKTTSLGTPHYAAPEQINNPDAVSPAADIFALGCVFHAMLTGASPFAADSVVEALSRLSSGRRDPPPAELSAFSKRLLDDMLQPDAKRRPQNGSDLLERLQGLPESRSQEQRIQTFGAFLSGETANETKVYEEAEHTRAQQAAANRSEATKLWQTNVTAATRGPAAGRTQVRTRASIVSPTAAAQGPATEPELPRPRRSIAWVLAPLGLAGVGGITAVLLREPIAPVVVETPVIVEPPAPEPSLATPTPLPLPPAPDPVAVIPVEPPIAPPVTPSPSLAPKVKPKPVVIDTRPATVTFFTKPWAKVSVDGAILGTTPVFNTTELAPGPHRFRFEHPTHQIYEMQTTLAPGERREVNVELKK